MADDFKLITKGDYSKVPVQIAPGGTGAIERPTKGSLLVWGGSDPSSPWGLLSALIAKSGGGATYLQVSAAELARSGFEPKGAPGEAPAPGADPAPKDDKPEDDGAPTQVAAVPHPHAPGLEHVSGAPGEGPLFDAGIDVGYQGEPTRIWAHPRAANSGPRPLVIYLHGINSHGHLHPALSENVGKPGLGWMHMGKLAQSLIGDGKVTPLAMAAPTHSSAAPWDRLDFEELVNIVEAKFRENGVEIDLDQIAVVGEGGAAGYHRRGMNKLADQGGMIGSHKLKLFGLADARMISTAAKIYQDGLAKNDTAAIYAVHRGTGGWSPDEYNAHGGSAAFAKALGASNQNKKQVVADEDLESVEEYWDNQGATPARVSIKVKQPMSAFVASWRAVGGYGTADLGHHDNTLARWTWWALPRFFAQTDADKKLLAAASSDAPDAPAAVPPPPAVTAVTGGEFNIPPAAAPWTNPAGDIPPKALDGFEFAPASGLYYPVRAEKLPAGRGVYYLGQDDQSYGPSGRGSGGAGYFLAGRSGGRKHAGIDMAINAFNALVVACESGTIVNFYQLHENAWCLIIQGDSGLVINYGEIDADSLKDHKLKKGAHVAAGQPIGNIRKLETEAMLHFETYRSGTNAGCEYFPNGTSAEQIAKTKQAKAKLFNPTQYVLALAKSGQ